MAEFETLLFDLEDHVATITLNRPATLNAMSKKMFDELPVAFRAVAADPEVRCVVVTGAGGAFCSGADLSDPENLVTSAFEGADRVRSMNELVRLVIDCPKPTISKVDGVAAGAGASLALGCDLIVATPRSRFIQVFVKRGLVVDFGGSWILTRQLPLNKAKELALLGDEIDGAAADRLGLLNRLCSETEIDAVVSDLATRLAALPPRAVMAIKRNLNRAADLTLAESLADEEASQALAFMSEDTREAVMAFFEKRDPKFTGR